MLVKQRTINLGTLKRLFLQVVFGLDMVSI